MIFDLYLLYFLTSLINVLQIIATFFVNLLFLGDALTTMIVYVWSRRNPYVRYTFFGLFNFQAPYLPWILVLLSILFNGSLVGDLVGESNYISPDIEPICWSGIAVGHIYYFLMDVFPNKPGGFQILKTPHFMWDMQHHSYMILICIYSQFRKLLFDGPQNDPNYAPLPEDRPGGFDWGDGRPLGQQ